MKFIFIILLIIFLLFCCKNIQENFKENSFNIYDEKLERCTPEFTDKPTGYYRDGYCNTGNEDKGTHTVCAKMTNDFLNYTLSRGNDLITPKGNSFKGLKENDYWCLCAFRWKQAYDKNPDLAPRIKTRSTHKKTLDFINKNILDSYN